MIKGTPSAVRAVATIVNKDSGLPIASPAYPCQGLLRCVDCGTVAPYGSKRCAVCPVLVDTEYGPTLRGGKLAHDGCGYPLIEVADYDKETVRCPACGVVTPAGDRGATIQVQRVRKVDATTAEYDGGAELEEKIAKAKSKTPDKQSADEKALAKVEVVKDPKAKDINR